MFNLADVKLGTVCFTNKPPELPKHDIKNRNNVGQTTNSC